MNLHPEIASAWPCYRLVLERVATWDAIQRMTIDDVDLMCIALDEWRAAEIRAQKER